MKSLLTFRAAFLMSTLTLLIGWQASVPGQDVVDLYGYSAGDDFVIIGRAWETDFQKLRKENPAELNSQQLRILDGGLESETEALTKQYAAADEAQRKELESQLAETVAQHFAVRQAIRDREIAKVEKEVSRLRELLQQREDAKQPIVQGRVDQLIRSAKGLGWDGNVTAARPAAPALGLPGPMLQRAAGFGVPGVAPMRREAGPAAPAAGLGATGAGAAAPATAVGESPERAAPPEPDKLRESLRDAGRDGF